MPAQRKPPPFPVERVIGARRFKWPLRLARLLGRISDDKLAKKAGVNANTVSGERRRRGISQFRPRRPAIRWTRRMIALLGSDADSSVAALLGLTRATVGRKRRELGIPSVLPPPHDKLRAFPWTAAQLRLLGTMTDAEVARRIRVSAPVVHRQRVRMGICAFKPPPPRIRWTRRMISALGKRSDAEVAERLRIGMGSVKKKRESLKIPPHFEKRPVRRDAGLRRLLRVPPSVARRQSGLKYETLGLLRAQYGIEVSRRRDLPWKNGALKRLGSMPDKQLAEELGVALSTVRDKRRALGIPPWRRWRRWTAEEIAVLRSPLTIDELTRQLNHPPGSIQAKRLELAMGPSHRAVPAAVRRKRRPGSTRQGGR
jgi:hypothetical protein